MEITEQILKLRGDGYNGVVNHVYLPDIMGNYLKYILHMFSHCNAAKESVPIPILDRGPRQRGEPRTFPTYALQGHYAKRSFATAAIPQ